MTYKIRLIYRILIGLMLVLSLTLLSVAVMITKDNMQSIIATVVTVFSGFYFLGIAVVKVKINGDILYYKNILIEKSIDMTKITDVSPVFLKGRVLLMISDEENYTFISSWMDKFLTIVDYIKKYSNEDSLKKISQLSEKSLNIRFAVSVVIMLLVNAAIVYSIIKVI